LTVAVPAASNCEIRVLMLPSSPHRIVAAVDSALHVVLEVLAFGAGGRQLYDDFHITRLVSVNTLSMDALAVRRQVGLDGVVPGCSRQRPRGGLSLND
jgi:hypothetical protein